MWFQVPAPSASANVGRQRRYIPATRRGQPTPTMPRMFQCQQLASSWWVNNPKPLPRSMRSLGGGMSPDVVMIAAMTCSTTWACPPEPTTPKVVDAFETLTQLPEN